MRCDARTQVPCFRCRSAGRDCILDPMEDGRRRSERRKKTGTPSTRYAPPQLAFYFTSILSLYNRIEHMEPLPHGVTAVV